MPQRNLRHSHYIYSNHSDNKLITLFCNQFATTPPKNPVFSGISSVFLLFKLAKFEVWDIVFHWFSIHICIENMYILFQLFFVLIDCSTILVPKFWYYLRYKSDKFSITVNGSSGWKWIFQLVLPWFGVPADTTGDSELQVTFQPWFYYRIHFCKLQEEFYVSKRFL